MKAIVNAQILLEDKILRDHVILHNEKIEKIVSAAEFASASCESIFDAQDAYVSPGFINEHIHGCAGIDVMDDTEDGLRTIGEALTQTGVTAYLPTTMTYDIPRIYRALERIRLAMGNGSGAKVLGANVEGPFISSAYKGAHDEQYIVKPTFDCIKEYADVIKIMTVAPETIEDDTFIEQCKAAGIILSLGHSGASYEEAIAAIQKGFKHITHMYNAMPVFNHRKPGVIGAAMDSDAICELITDNIHVHPAMQRILLQQKGIEQVILVTDSMRACMLPDGEYELGGQPVIVENHTAKLKNGVIAGSVLTMQNAIKNFMENTKLSLPESVALVTVNPAKELGVYAKMGSITPGKQADITIFNQDIEIMATIINGNVVYRRK